MVMWFGKAWGAPVCDDVSEHTATPIGQPCVHCRKPIVATDQGITMPHVGGRGVVGLSVFHLDCFLMTITPHGPECPHCKGGEGNRV